MSKHLQNAIEELKGKVLFLGSVVEASLRHAVESVEKRDAQLAERVIAGDAEVDRLEVNIEEECLKMLALYQPVAADLRFIVAVVKLNSDLERIGDQAVGIAEQSAYLASQRRIELPTGIRLMGEKAAWMVKSALDALIRRDPELARRVCAADDEIDTLKRDMLLWIEDAIAGNMGDLDLYIRALTIPRKLERIGDHATNIAEDVIYMTEGSIVRHLPCDSRQPV